MKKHLTNNILLKIASVVFSIMLWLIVLNIDDPDTTRSITNIPVNIEHEEAITGQDKVYTVIEGARASISVTGPRSIVDKLTSSDFTATANFQELSQTNAVPIVVEINNQSNKDKVSINQKTNTMRLNIEDIKEKKFEINVDFIGRLQDGYVIYESRLSENQVTVYAPESVMGNVADVVARVVGNGQSGDFTSEVELIAIDSNGREIAVAGNHITFSVNSVQVTNIVFMSKEVALVDNFENVMTNGYSLMEKEYSSDVVTIVGRKTDIEGINEIIIPEELFELDTNTKDYEIKVDIQSILPEGAYVYGDTKEIIVTMHIDKIVERTYTVDVRKLALANIPENYVASVDTKGTFAYSIEGFEEILAEYEMQDSYNVSLEGLTQGKHQVRVEIELPNGVTLKSDVYVDVILRNTEDVENTASPTETTKKEPESTTAWPTDPIIPEPATTPPSQEETTPEEIT